MSVDRLKLAGVLLVIAALVAGAVILISGAGKPDLGTVAACAGSEQVDFGCQERRYIELADAEGPAAALADLAAETERSGYVRAACHQLTHRIGRVAGEAAGINAFEDGDPLCSSGYYHGVTEAVMTGIGADSVVEEASSVCAELRAERPFSVDHSNCVHGMGHGFMAVLGRDLVESLHGCDALEGSWERQGCFSGVFMENLSTVDHPDPATLRPDRPLEPCPTLAERYRTQCYDRQTTYALFVNDGDFAAVFRLCSKTDPEFRPACYRGLGGDVAGETKVIDEIDAQAAQRHALCMVGRDALARSSCVAGAVDVILQDLEGGPAQADAFCRSFEKQVTQPLHAACLGASERAYAALLAQELGQDPERSQPAVGGDFVCHLKSA